MFKRKKVIKNDNQHTSKNKNNFTAEDRAEMDAERKNRQEYFRSKPRPSEILGHGIIVGETIIEATCKQSGLMKYTRKNSCFKAFFNSGWGVNQCHLVNTPNDRAVYYNEQYQLDFPLYSNGIMDF